MAHKTGNPPSDDEWKRTTWDGSRREQIRRWLRLSVRERLEIIEQLCHTADRLAKGRKIKQP